MFEGPVIFVISIDLLLLTVFCTSVCILAQFRERNVSMSCGNRTEATRKKKNPSMTLLDQGELWEITGLVCVP